MRAGDSGRGAAAGGHGSDVVSWAAERRLYVDNLKVILIAVVIAGHAIVGYSEFDWWSYADVREVTLSSVTAIVLIVVAAPFALLVIPLLFLVAGLLTAPSVERKGPGRFATDRLLRLGVPFAVFALLLPRWSTHCSAGWEVRPNRGPTCAERGASIRASCGSSAPC